MKLSPSIHLFRSLIHSGPLLFSAIFLILIANLSPSVFASTSIQDYKKRLEAARSYTDELIARGEDRDADSDRRLVAAIRAEIPNSERIEWPSGSVETNNSWLDDELKFLADEPDTDKRAASLSRIVERLAAITANVSEIERDAAVERTKDRDKQKLAEILAREEYRKPEASEESLFARWWREFLAWLARVFPTRPDIAPSTASGFGSLQIGLQILIFAVILGLIGFLIFKFAPFLSGRFRRNSRGEKHSRVILGERISDDDSARDIFAEAERLARDGDIRGAIRKGYIALLCDLSDRKHVRLARHKTNRDYLRDVSSNDELFQNLSGVTGNFETNWYGLRTPGLADWEHFRSLYLRIVASAK